MSYCEHDIIFEITDTDDVTFDIDVRDFVDRIVAPDKYSGVTEVTPSDSEQVLPTTDKLVREDITIFPAPTEILSTDHNGTFTPSSGKVGFSSVTVDVNPDLRPLSVSENGSYQPDGFDGYESVVVDVPNRGYDIPKIDDGNAHIWVDVLDSFKDMKVFCWLRGETVVSVDWGDGTETEIYYGRNNVNTMNHDYEQAGFYHITLKTVKEPRQVSQKGLGGSGNSWLLGGSGNPRRFYQICLVGFESGNWYIQGGQLLYDSSCYTAYCKRATGFAYNNYLSNSSRIRHYELPDIVTSLTNSFFENDRCVSDFVIPERIVTMGSYIFSNTGNIRIHMGSAVPPTLSGSFGNNCSPTIYVPVGSLEAYKTAPNWSNYADSIFEEPTT